MLYGLEKVVRAAENNESAAGYICLGLVSIPEFVADLYQLVLSPQDADHPIAQRKRLGD